MNLSSIYQSINLFTYIYRYINILDIDPYKITKAYMIYSYRIVERDINIYTMNRIRKIYIYIYIYIQIDG